MYSSVQAAISARPAFLCLDELQKLQEAAWRTPIALAGSLNSLGFGFFFFGTSGWSLRNGWQGYGTLAIVVHDVVQDFIFQVHYGGGVQKVKKYSHYVTSVQLW